MTPALASAAMVMMIKRTESDSTVVGYSANDLIEVDINAEMPLEETLTKIQEVPERSLCFILFL